MTNPSRLAPSMPRLANGLVATTQLARPASTTSMITATEDVAAQEASQHIAEAHGCLRVGSRCIPRPEGGPVAAACRAQHERVPHDVQAEVAERGASACDDRYFLDNVAEWILELDRGRALPFKGNYSAWLEQKQERLALEEKQESARQRKLKHELEWARSAPKARQAKGKARLRAYDELLNEQRGRSATPTRSSFLRVSAWATW